MSPAAEQPGKSCQKQRRFHRDCKFIEGGVVVVAEAEAEAEAVVAAETAAVSAGVAEVAAVAAATAVVVVVGTAHKPGVDQVVWR
jgi:hypothetical protein